MVGTGAVSGHRCHQANVGDQPSQPPAEPGRQMQGGSREASLWFSAAGAVGAAERLRFPSSPAVVLSSLWEGSQLLGMTTLLNRLNWELFPVPNTLFEIKKVKGTQLLSEFSS